MLTIQFQMELSKFYKHVKNLLCILHDVPLKHCKKNNIDHKLNFCIQKTYKE